MLIVVLVSIAILGPVIVMWVSLPEVISNDCYVTQDNRPLVNKQSSFTRKG